MKKQIQKQPVHPLLKYVRPGLNIHQLEQAKSLFDLFDNTKTGRISPKDIKQAIQQQGKQAMGTALYQLLCDMDEEGRGYIDFQTFLFFVNETVSGNQSEEEAKKLFSLFDDQKTGFISISGLRRVCKSLHMHFDELDLQEMMKQADRNQDGFVSFQQFWEIISYRS